jgi:hypothetical protein
MHRVEQDHCFFTYEMNLFARAADIHDLISDLRRNDDTATKRRLSTRTAAPRRVGTTHFTTLPTQRGTHIPHSYHWWSRHYD